MTASSILENVIRLDPLAGPPIDPVEINAGKPCTLGRGTMCEAQLADQTVSRRHAMVAFRADTWFVTDLESRHGTFVNGVRLEVNTPSPINEGDLLRIGPWTFRVRSADAPPSTLPTTNDFASTGHRVQHVPQQELRSIAQQRLELLIECAAQINASPDENSLAKAVLDAVTSGTGFPRAALIRTSGADVEVIGYRGPSQRDAPSHDLAFSRSLINAASGGGVVRLTSQSQPGAYGESIMRLGIHSALCAPVYIGDTVAAYLYLDARHQESQVQADAAAFCQAVCRMFGLALANLKRASLQKLNEEIMRDVGAAAAAQKLLMPPPHGQIGPLAYFMRMRPGRMVAGDLFNIMPLPDGRVAAYLGDVAGKGVGAAILMATTQTMLNQALRHDPDPAVALNEVNAQISRQIVSGRFISLWAGVFDPVQNAVRFVDAGHGHWLYRSASGRPHKLDASGGLPLGVDADVPYESEQAPFPIGARMIVFSDGVVEQPSPEGQEFGLDRILATLADADSTDAEVNSLFEAVRRFAGTDNLSDDVTVASLEYRAR
ncbi:MAG: SpoIIE family protein phosphatase [Phycisphaeraceae bacterium]|nr:SpoIIE family protein phosphatase [Phycisphaeraceae bacterium]